MLTSIPPLQELRSMYADVMSDEAITDLSYWNEPNTSDPCDEQEYLDKCLAEGDTLNDKIGEALKSVHRKGNI